MAPEAGARGAVQAMTRVGKYQILGRIGHGAMGQVFRALDPLLNRQVAIKTMVADVSADLEQSRRFLVEAQSAARLNHPNIVTLHDFGEDNGQFYMAMELLEGQDLSAVIKQRRLESLDDKLALMEQVCDGLAFAHAMDVVHRDLKPANIHVQSNGRVKIMDFGLARLGRSEMTRAGTVMGSPNYMSPEQVRGERADTRSDVFALGAVFYEVLSGHRAFSAESMHAILYKVTDTEPEPLSHLDPDLPAIVIQVIERALRKDPRQRFADARELREALDVCRRVLEGTIDEETGRASIHESSTLLESTPATVSSVAVTHPALATPRGTTGATPVVRSGPAGGTRHGGTAMRGPRSRPGSLPASSPSSVPTVTAFMGPLYAAVGVTALAVVAVACFALLRGRPAPAPPPADTKTSALAVVALDAQLDVARKSLEYKDPRAAIDVAVQEARTAAQAGDTEKATQKALEAKKAFDIARASAAALPSSKPATPVAVVAPPPTVSATIAPPLPTVSATIAPPPPTVPQPIVAATTAPVVTTPVTLPAAVSDDTQVRRLISEFARAIEEKDVALYKTLRPTLSAVEERNLKTAFQYVRSQSVNFNVDSLAFDGESAVVRVTRTSKVNGEAQPVMKQVLRLAKGPAGWTIRDIGQ